MTEIQQAIERLPLKKRKAISAWLASQDEVEMSDQEEASLLASLDRATRQLKAGKGVAIEEVRSRVRRWASR